jgi:hypothetical protein
MFIFQLRAVRSSIPDNFFDGVPLALIQPTTQLINRFIELNPNATLSHRKEFFNMIYYAIPRKEDRYLEDRVYTRNPTQFDIESGFIAVSRFLAIVNTSQATEQNIRTVRLLEENGFIFQKTMTFQLANFYNSNIDFRNYVDQLIGLNNSNPSSRDRLLHITTILSRAEQNMEAAPYDLLGAYLRNIQNYTVENKTEALYRAADFYNRYGVEGLHYIEHFSRHRNVLSSRTTSTWHELTVYDNRQATFTAQRAENLINFMQNFRRMADEVREIKIARSGSVREDIGSIGLGGFRPNQRILEGMNYGQVVTQAMQTMDRFGLDVTDRELLFNFVYAIATIGSEMAAQIHSRLGIVHFARYTQHTLEEIYHNITNPTRDQRPVAFLYMNRQADWNNAFYNDSTQVDSLTRGYRLIIVEDSTDHRFYQSAIQTATRLGPIRAVGIGGHGKPDEIRVGPGRSEESFIDLTDTTEMNLLLDRNILTRDAIIFMIACSTGNTEHGSPIAQETSRALGGRRVFAPSIPTNIREFEFDGTGMITNVHYNEESATRTFSSDLLAIRPRRNVVVE